MRDTSHEGTKGVEASGGRRVGREVSTDGPRWRDGFKEPFAQAPESALSELAVGGREGASVASVQQGDARDLCTGEKRDVHPGAEAERDESPEWRGE